MKCLCYNKMIFLKLKPRAGGHCLIPLSLGVKIHLNNDVTINVTHFDSLMNFKNTHYVSVVCVLRLIPLNFDPGNPGDGGAGNS